MSIPLILSNCSHCGSENISEEGFDIYPVEKDQDVIEEYQYLCYDCNKFSYVRVSMKYGVL